MGNSPTPTLGEPWSLKAEDVAEYLGLTREEVYRIPPEELPVGRPRGRRRRYRPSDVKAYMAARVEGGEGGTPRGTPP